jgi:hypothetical protein
MHGSPMATACGIPGDEAPSPTAGVGAGHHLGQKSLLFWGFQRVCPQLLGQVRPLFLKYGQGLPRAAPELIGQHPTRFVGQ